MSLRQPPGTQTEDGKRKADRGTELGRAREIAVRMTGKPIYFKPGAKMRPLERSAVYRKARLSSQSIQN